VAEYETKLLVEMLLNRFHDGKGKTACWAFIVPVLNQRYGGMFIARDVVGSGYRNLQ
jgi:hypothetical protein